MPSKVDWKVFVFEEVDHERPIRGGLYLVAKSHNRSQKLSQAESIDSRAEVVRWVGGS